MNTYHGTSKQFAAALSAGNVDVTRGGGELGRGFYTGEYLHEAKAWAFNRFGEKQENVVCFATPDEQVERLELKLLEPSVATSTRYRLRQTNQTRTYLFHVDMVWAPIVGSSRAVGDQCKWESSGAQTFLNSPDTTRTVI